MKSAATLMHPEQRHQNRKLQLEDARPGIVVPIAMMVVNAPMPQFTVTLARF